MTPDPLPESRPADIALVVENSKTMSESASIEKKSRKWLMKLGLSILIISILLSMVDTSALLATLSTVPLSVAALLLVGYIAGQIISAFKWWLIARSAGIKASFLTALRSYFMGMFVNCFGLGMVGGDVTRGLLLASNRDSKTKAIATVIADRAHGLAVLALIGLIATAVLGSSNLDFSWQALLLAISSLIVSGWLLCPWLLLKVVPADNRLRSKVEDLSKAFPKDPKTILLVTLVSVAFHFLQISLHLLMSEGVGSPLSFGLLLISIPFINIVSSLPISWNGVGVREAGYIFFLTSGSFSNEQAVAMGALWLMASTISSMLGGLLGLFSKDLSLKQISATKR